MNPVQKFKRKKLEDDICNILRCYERAVYSDWYNIENSFTRRTFAQQIIQRMEKK